MVLAKDHLARRAVLGAPGADATLQCPAQAIPVALGMAALHFLQHRHRPQARTGGEQRHDVGLPQAAERVGDCRRSGRSAAFCEGSRGSLSIRRPVRSLMPVLAAAMSWESWWRNFMYILICWSVAGRPGTSGLS
jgi:hypothetical protein